MKYNLFCFFGILLLVLASTASAGLVAEYLFDTDGSDTSGFGNNGSLENGAVVVAEIQYLVSSLSNDINFPSYAVVEGVYFSLIDPIQGFPAYLEAPGSPGVALHGTLGHPSQDGLPQLIMNGDCLGVGVEDASFGSVKSLYR